MDGQILSDPHEAQLTSSTKPRPEELEGLSDEQPSQSQRESSLNLSELMIIRHGERADQVPEHPWNLAEKARRKDPPLTDLGRYQARSVGLRLRMSGVKAKVIYSSPLQRCLETACEIAHQLKLPIKVVVPLAKPCNYFRKCAVGGIAPQFAPPEEAEGILKDIHSDVELLDFQLDDGSTSRETMEQLAAQACQEQPDESCPQTIIVSHCEALKEMARATGLKERMHVPFCGVAVFELEGGVGGVTWSLAMTPREHR